MALSNDRSGELMNIEGPEGSTCPSSCAPQHHGSIKHSKTCTVVHNGFSVVKPLEQIAGCLQQNWLRNVIVQPDMNAANTMNLQKHDATHVATCKVHTAEQHAHKHIAG
jgi:hypothetical protein